jgi:hypothetical protein
MLKTILHRLEQAIYSVPRNHFFCINEFNLEDQVTVTFEKEGFFSFALLEFLI